MSSDQKHTSSIETKKEHDEEFSSLENKIIMVSKKRWHHMREFKRLEKLYNDLTMELENLCNEHIWEVDHSGYSHNTHRICVKCGKYR